MLPHCGIQRLLARMPKRWVPNVMDQSQRLDQVYIESNLRGDRPRNLCHFNRMCQPVAKMVGVSPRKDLRFRFQPPKRASMHDAIAIALKVVAVRMGRLRMTASARLLHAHRIVGEHAKSVAAEAELASSRPNVTRSSKTTRRQKNNTRQGSSAETDGEGAEKNKCPAAQLFTEGRVGKLDLI